MIRKAKIEELDAIMPLYEEAKAYMNRTGNTRQWIDGYPSRDRIAADIRAGYCHVVEEAGRLLAAFAYIEGDDPTYGTIEDGAWLDDAPYAVVHRLASGGRRKGIGKECLDWSFARCGNLRADTHSDNLTMQHILETSGFVRCGIIYTHNGTPRTAYQKTRVAAGE